MQYNSLYACIFFSNDSQYHKIGYYKGFDEGEYEPSQLNNLFEIFLCITSYFTSIENKIHNKNKSQKIILHQMKTLPKRTNSHDTWNQPRIQSSMNVNLT